MIVHETTTHQMTVELKLATKIGTCEINKMQVTGDLKVSSQTIKGHRSDLTLHDQIYTVNSKVND